MIQTPIFLYVILYAQMCAYFYTALLNKGQCVYVLRAACLTVISWYSFRTLDVTLDLKDPHYPDHDLGSLDLAVTLTPKEGDFRETVSVFLYLHTLVYSFFFFFA